MDPMKLATVEHPIEPKIRAGTPHVGNLFLMSR
jgi:hypothetical protein